MVSALRTDLWAAAFVRRHNDLGHICVVVRRGDPIAGQMFVELDHLNGTASLFTPAPATMSDPDDAGRRFQLRFDHVEPERIAKRIAQEVNVDPDLWVLSLELRQGDHGLEVVS